MKQTIKERIEFTVSCIIKPLVLVTMLTLPFAFFIIVAFSKAV